MTDYITLATMVDNMPNSEQPKHTWNTKHYYNVYLLLAEITKATPRALNRGGFCLWIPTPAKWDLVTRVILRATILITPIKVLITSFKKFKDTQHRVSTGACGHQGNETCMI